MGSNLSFHRSRYAFPTNACYPNPNPTYPQMQAGRYLDRHLSEER